MKPLTKKLALPLAAAVALLSACSGSDSGGSGTERLQWASYLGPKGADTVAAQKIIERVETATDGSLTIDLAHSGSLLAGPDILAGVKSARADIGTTSYIYHPGELPLSHVVNVPYVTSNIPAQSRAFQELGSDNTAFKDEYEKQGLKLLYIWVVGEPVMGCKKPITSYDDLKGLKVATGGLVAKAYEAAGATVVTVPASDYRDSLERGLVDCWGTLPLDVVADLGLADVTANIYDFGYQNYGHFSAVMDLNRWNGLSDEHRAAIETAIDETLADIVAITDSTNARGCKAIQTSPATFERLDDSVISAWKEDAEPAVASGFFKMAKATGADGEAFLPQYRAAVEDAEAEFADYESALSRCIAGTL
ncbi:TRAP transporter substrate-binding protein DctP [Aeromicrobium sp.]|uniref:TRAP transporter substrate-binding protein DctP n=1 Tax=Aeromicrobium sp. TaxID=1871063 RepID=UPI0028A7B951|nr:TRAP transporter substrate-binding protein DctP [Aeromicrobium sp.]